MKLLVTSVFVYAGTVASSQSLFLFSIGLINFVVAYSYNSYKNYYDGLLASAFAFIHMCLFFLVLISTSYIGSQVISTSNHYKITLGSQLFWQYLWLCLLIFVLKFLMSQIVLTNLLRTIF